MTNTDILIIGGGPTGLALAIDLARRGVAIRTERMAPADVRVPGLGRGHCLPGIAPPTRARERRPPRRHAWPCHRRLRHRPCSRGYVMVRPDGYAGLLAGLDQPTEVDRYLTAVLALNAPAAG